MVSKVSTMLTRIRKSADRAARPAGLDHEALTGRYSPHDWAAPI